MGKMSARIKKNLVSEGKNRIQEIFSIFEYNAIS